MARILVVDDDMDAAGSIKRVLNNAGFDVLTAGGAAEALAILEEQGADLLVLDIMMPDISGIELCRRLRADPYNAHLPIIFLTALSRAADVAAGLDAGGDDYIAKPFEVVELPARVRALLRRTAGPTQDSGGDELALGGLRLKKQQPRAQFAGQEIPLTSTEHRLLYHLFTHAGRPQSIDNLLQSVWEYPAGTGDPALVYAHIKNLRRKLAEVGVPEPFIQTVHGRGYVIAA